jgi:hypothetical protein
MHSKLFKDPLSVADSCFPDGIDSMIRTPARLSYTLDETAAKQVEAC